MGFRVKRVDTVKMGEEYLNGVNYIIHLNMCESVILKLTV